MSVLDRKLRRELKESWGMLLAVIGIIAVGVACYVSMGSAYNNLNEAKRRYYAQCRMADFSIALKKAPLTEMALLRALPEVVQIRPRIRFYATVDVENSIKPLNGLVLSLPGRQKPVINDIVLQRGSYFTDRRRNEVIVNKAFAEAHHLKPGNWIHLVLNNHRQELFIVGTAISSEFVYMLPPGAVVPDAKQFGVFYLKHRYAEEVFNFEGATNEIVGRLTPEARQSPRAVLLRMEQLLAPYGVVSTVALKNQMSNLYLSQEIKGLRSFAVFMPIIFLAVAAGVLNVLLSRLAEQQRTIVGTLKAVGYSNRMILVHFLKFSLAIGVAGGLLGCGLGYWMANGMTVEYRKFFEFPELNNYFYPGLQITGVSISIVCAIFGSIRGTGAVLKLRPAEAMRPKPPKQGGAILLERFTTLWHRLGTDWRMVLRSVIRNRGRTLAGTFAAMMGASVLVNGFMMADAADFLVNFQFKWILRSDIDLSFKEECAEEALLEVSRLPGVDRAEPLLHVSGTFYNGPYLKKGGITGLISEAQLTVPRDLQARPVRIPSVGVVMTRKLAELLHVKPGYWVSFRPSKGLRRTVRVPIVKITDSFLGMAVYADIHYLSRLIGEEFVLNGAQLTTDQNSKHQRALYQELKRLPLLQGVNTRREMVRSLEATMVDQMWVFIGMLILFAGIVFFGSILNASLISLAERRREVAMLRVLGYGPWRIGNLLLRESMIVTLLGTFLGMPLGYLFSVWVAMFYNSEMFRFPVIAQPSTWVWTFVLAILFGLLAHLVVQRTIHRIDWLEDLKAKE